MSVDLVGSTIFKSQQGARLKDDRYHPIWVDEVRSFYRNFPTLLKTQFENVVKARTNQDITGEADKNPRVWKTIGDEIIFCSKIESLDHLSDSVFSFLKALALYGEVLESKGFNLDVKGSGWLAEFPSRNMTVEIIDRDKDDSEILDEAFEKRADECPSDHDFLGPEIDAGFRVARNSSADKFTPSIELAYLLAEAAHLGLFAGKFRYHGRQIFKGVLRDGAYPVVSIDTERSAAKRELRAYERALSGTDDADPIPLKQFLYSFMMLEGVIVPQVTRAGQDARDDFPAHYKEFERKWALSAEDAEKQTVNEKAAAAIEEEPDTAGDQIIGPAEPSELAHAETFWLDAIKKLIDVGNQGGHSPADGLPK